MTAALSHSRDNREAMDVLPPMRFTRENAADLAAARDEVLAP